MKVQKVNKCLNIIFIISLICICISIIFIIAYSFLSGKIYLSVSDKNRNQIIKMLEESESIVNSSEIIINNDIVRIGKMQGLGDWYLYIKYDNEEEKSVILSDGELRELYQYIDNKGSLGGTLGVLTEIFIKLSIISIIFIPIYITFKICYYINMITEKQIQKDKD